MKCPLIVLAKGISGPFGHLALEVPGAWNSARCCGDPHRLKRHSYFQKLSVVKRTTHMQEPLMTHMDLLRVLFCGSLCVRVCVSVSVYEGMYMHTCV